MTSKELAQEIRLTEWGYRLRTRRESGLTVRAWCSDNGINEKTYYYWQNKLRQVASEHISERETPKTGMLPVPAGWATVATRPAGPGSGTVGIEIGKSRVVADSSTNLELLSEVCRMLMTLC